jgi:hypothetical protein
MPRLIGPDFIGTQVADLNAARTFYTQVVGLTAAPNGPPETVVFDTKPIPFAVRAFPPKDGPFGRDFAFQDPFGYTITAHTMQETA